MNEAAIEDNPLQTAGSDEPVDSPEVESTPATPLQLLMDRKNSGYRRGIDDDGHKVGLTFDAGAYAGVISLSMSKELEKAGLLDYVDAFYGLSAGGVNAAYAATHQIDEGIDTYVNLMPDNNFFSPGQLMPPKLPQVDLNVLRTAVTEQHPLKLDELVNSKVPVVVGVTNLDTSEPMMIRSTDINPEHPEEFIDWMIRGCHLPHFAGKPLEDSERVRYSDATLTWPTTVDLAKADGCTDIISLANTPQTDSVAEANFKTKAVAKTFEAVVNRFMTANRQIGGGSPNTSDIILDTFGGDIAFYSNTMRRKSESQRIFNEGLFDYEGALVERIYPPDIPQLPELLTSDKRRLKIGVYAGKCAVEAAFKELELSAAAA